MKFVKYNSIENHYNPRPIRAIQEMGLDHPNIKWSVREKMHGANFSFWYDGVTMHCAKRSGFIQPLENFFDYQVVLHRYLEAIKGIYEVMIEIELMERGQVMTVFGELAGQMRNGKKVQKEVDYGELDFYMFDIVANGKYVADPLVSSMAQRFKISEAPLLGIGTFTEMSKTINNFDSLYMLGKPDAPITHEFPKLEKGEKNVAEGYVLKPCAPAFFHNGSRVIIKCKSEEFQERKSRASVDRMTKLATELSDKDLDMVGESNRYIVEPRLRNVLSKRGPVTNHKEFGGLLAELFDDVMEDLEKDNVILKTADDPSEVYRQVKLKCSQLIRLHWIAILAGEF